MSSLVSENLPQVLTVWVTWTHVEPCAAEGCHRHIMYPAASETAAGPHASCFNAQSAISFSPPTPVSLSPLPLSHLLWRLAMTISMASVKSLEKVGPWWEIACPVLHLKCLHRRAQRDTREKCQPDTVENRKEGWGREAMAPYGASRGRGVWVDLAGEAGPG